MKANRALTLLFLLSFSLVLVSCGGNDANKLVGEGNGHEAKGDLDRANGCYEKALSIDPDNEAAKNSLKRINQRLQEKSK